jgi:hypothetical protein
MTDKESAEGRSPFVEGLGVSPNLNSLESLFGKEGLREFGTKGVDPES